MRTSFQDAIEDDMLLKDAFDGMSFPHQVTLKALYGCELSKDRINPETGWSELDYWAITQGSCDYDELGFVTKVRPIPYEPREYEQLWAVIGRRAGKTSQLQSFIIAYEATLGGHEDCISPGQECNIYLIAQRLSVAETNLPFVRNILVSSPLLSREILDGPQNQIVLKNGIKIIASPPSLKAQRGLAIPVVAMDEVSFWYKDPESANPDFEVERAVSWAQLQFPHFKRVGISTPWSKEGLLWKYHRAGTNGCKLPKEERAEYQNILVVFGTTAAYENPRITRDRLWKEKVKDGESFERESLCVFPDSISGFLSRDLVEKAAAKGKGIAERSPVKWDEAPVLPTYVAAMDPAFRQDSFAFTILHKESHKGIVVDVLRRWTPIRGQKLNPKEILSEIKPLLDDYKVDILYTDQYQLESLQQLALEMNIIIEGIDFTAKSKAKIFGNLQQLFNQQKIELLDPNLNEDAKSLVQELIQLERRLTSMGSIQISAPEGKHDDMAAVLALGAKQAMLFDSIDVDRSAPKPKTLYEMGWETIRKKQLIADDW